MTSQPLPESSPPISPSSVSSRYSPMIRTTSTFVKKKAYFDSCVRRIKGEDLVHEFDLIDSPVPQRKRDQKRKEKEESVLRRLQQGLLSSRKPTPQRLPLKQCLNLRTLNTPAPVPCTSTSVLFKATPMPDFKQLHKRLQSHERSKRGKVTMPVCI